MEKAKYNEIPKEYRRNYKKEFVKILMALGIGICVSLFTLLMAWIA